jgi:hypothetical protein
VKFKSQLLTPQLGIMARTSHRAGSQPCCKLCLSWARSFRRRNRIRRRLSLSRRKQIRRQNRAMFTNRALWRTAGALAYSGAFILALLIALLGVGPSLILAIILANP